MSNDILQEALKIAIVDAFFNQKSYYTDTGGTRTYGGELQNVVAKLLPMINLEEVLASVLEKINTDPDIKMKMTSMIISTIPNLFDNRNHWNETHQHSKITVQDALSKILLSSPEFKDQVLARVKLEDKNIEINVVIKDKERK